MTLNTTEIAITAGVSFVCGIAQFAQGVREGRNQKHLLDLTADIASAMVAGATVYAGGKSQGLDTYFIYFLVLAAANNAAEVKAKAGEQLTNLFGLFKGFGGRR